MFKLKLAQSLMLGLVIVTSMGLPFSLVRWASIGFQPVYIVHILVTVLAYLFYFKQDKNNYKLYMLVIVALLTMTVVSGVLSFGLQSGAMAFSVFCSFVIAIGWGVKIASAYAISWCLFVLSTGYLFTNNYLSFTVTPNEYSDTMGAWTLVAVGSSMIVIFMLIIARQAFELFKSLIEKIEAQKQEIEILANQDSMTGCISNRLSNPNIQQAIEIAAAEQTKLALLYVDLNKFKQINDTFGHHTGDDVLIEFSNRLRTVLRSRDTRYRVGGDEFLLLFPHIDGPEEATRIADRIVKTWEKPIRSNGKDHPVSGSIGIAMYPDDGTSAEALRKNADAAMYSAKRKGKDYAFFAETNINHS